MSKDARDIKAEESIAKTKQLAGAYITSAMSTSGATVNVGDEVFVLENSSQHSDFEYTAAPAHNLSNPRKIVIQPAIGYGIVIHKVLFYVVVCWLPKEHVELHG